MSYLTMRRSSTLSCISMNSIGYNFRSMAGGREGAIANVGSIGAQAALDDSPASAYSMDKAGAMQSLNAFHPLGRVGTPEDMANTISSSCPTKLPGGLSQSGMLMLVSWPFADKRLVSFPRIFPICYERSIIFVGNTRLLRC